MPLLLAGAGASVALAGVFGCQRQRPVLNELGLPHEGASASGVPAGGAPGGTGFLFAPAAWADRPSVRTRWGALHLWRGWIGCDTPLGAHAAGA